MSNQTSPSVQAGRVKANEVDGEAIAQLLPIMILIVIANGLVFILFAKRKELRTRPNYVLFSLAICDLTTGVINIPLFILVAFTPVITSAELKFHLVFLIGVLNNLTAISACYHILAATTEKYLSIIWPVTHRLIKRKTVIKALGAVWVASVFVAFIPFAWVNMGDKALQTNLSIGHVIFCLITVFLLPYSFMIYAFVVIFLAISKQGRSHCRKPSKQRSSRQARQAALEKRCLILFASMATIFLVCWLPWYVLMLLFRISYNGDELRIPSHVFVLVRYTTSVINPMLYTFFRRDFKTALKSLFQSRRSRMSSLLVERKNDCDKAAEKSPERTDEQYV